MRSDVLLVVAGAVVTAITGSSAGRSVRTPAATDVSLVGRRSSGVLASP
jgi:hypothetical protein